MTGFEPATSWSQTSALAKLSHTPLFAYMHFSFLFDTRYILQLLFLSVKYFFYFFQHFFVVILFSRFVSGLIAFNVLYHTIVFLFCQHLFSKKFKQFQKFQTILIFTVFAAIFSHLLSNAAFLLFQECLRHCCCAVYVIHPMTYSSVHLCNPPEAISSFIRDNRFHSGLLPPHLWS